jgi:hypothetical protein
VTVGHWPAPVPWPTQSWPEPLRQRPPNACWKYSIDEANPPAATARSRDIPEPWGRQVHCLVGVASGVPDVDSFPLLLICGPSAAGKSSVAWEVYWTLGRDGVPVANLDLDGVGYGPPPSAFGTWDMKITNAAALWRNYRAAGARCFVVSGLPALREQIDRAVGAMAGACPTVCVLTVSAKEQSERILRRARGLYAVEYGGAPSWTRPDGPTRPSTLSGDTRERWRRRRSRLPFVTGSCGR